MRTLKIRMTLAVFVTLFAVFSILLGLVDLSLGVYYKQQASAMVDLIRDNGGVIPDRDEYDNNYVKSDNSEYKNLDFDEESPYRTRYFLIHYTKDDSISEGDYEHIAAGNQKNAAALTEKALESGKTKGYVEGYFYSIEENSPEEITQEEGQEEAGVIIFLDCTRELMFQKTVLMITAIILIFLCLVVTFVFGLISGKLMKPFEENAKRQKQFITDASHELKTPLTIISANADVLALKEGENMWLDHIRDQVIQMNKLIGDLLALTKADEMSEEFIREKFDVVSEITKLWNDFGTAAGAGNITMEKETPDQLMIHGNREMIGRLLSVLLENAVKYTGANGKIILHLKSSKKQMMLTVYNTVQLAEDFDCTHLFDRFYRPDQSRTSQAGGHGIGLSIAKKIVENHRGKITAVREKEGICFRVILPL